MNGLLSTEPVTQSFGPDQSLKGSGIECFLYEKFFSDTVESVAMLLEDGFNFGVSSIPRVFQLLDMRHHLLTAIAPHCAMPSPRPVYAALPGDRVQIVR
jgi:hypothetical protein